MTIKPQHTPDLKIRECHYQGVLRYEILTQFSTRTQAEEVVRAMKYHEECIERLRGLLSFVDPMVINMHTGETLLEETKEFIAKAEGKSK